MQKYFTLCFEVKDLTIVMSCTVCNLVSLKSLKSEVVRTPTCELFPVVSLQLFPKLMKLSGTNFSQH